MATPNLRRFFFGSFLLSITWLLGVCGAALAQGDPPPASTPVVRVNNASEKLEMIVNTSRILTLGKNIPQAQVNNPEILALTPLSPTQVQVWAKKPGVTQINLWDEQQQIYTVDVLVLGDARELTAILTSEFPNAAVKVRPISNKVLISGYIDKPQDVDQIRQIAEGFYGKDNILTNLTVGGVQQVLLRVKVMEVSRTKLRQMGFDWTQASNGAFVISGGAGLLSHGLDKGVGSVLTQGGQGPAVPTFAFRVVNGNNDFLGVLDALRKDDLAKLLSEPNLVTVSGRSAFFHVGGEIPYLIPQGLGQSTIEWKKYGTRVDVVPIVLGNGRVRLEIRPEVSEVDKSRAEVSGVPAIKTSTVDTGVELEFGQTLAIAGLVQRRIEAVTRGLPLVSDVPYLGVLFRKVSETANEVESLVFVTPEIVDAMSPGEVPPCGPGERTTSPSDWDLYFKAKLEVPNPCPPCNGTQCNNGMPVEGAIPAPPTPGMGPGAEPAPQAAGANGQAKASGTTSYSRRYPTRVASRPATPNRYNPSKPQGTTPAAKNPGELPGFLGPIGYDAAE